MAHQSPLHSLHEQAEASFLIYGADAGGAPVVETFGEIEAEYAALRKGCILLDNPHIATLRITGDDRIPFLNRMITQELATIRPYQTVRSFWLNRKGRIDADLRLTNLPACDLSNPAPPNTASPVTDSLITHEQGLLVAVDILRAPVAVQTLDAFIIADDVTITDITDRVHRLALHGPTAAALLTALTQHTDGPPIADLNPAQSCRAAIAGCPLIIERADETGEPGYHLTMATEHVHAVYHQLLETGRGHNGDDTTNNTTNTNNNATPNYRLRPAGWHAYNIARIEAGTPIYNIDFGTDNLPAETGVLHDRVSFRKGCYLGQEVVARMDALGHPKQTLIALRIPRAGHESNEWQPATGSPVLSAPDDATDPKPVGRITSSTRSPMLGDDILAFAQIKWAHRAPGTKLAIQTAAGTAQATVSESLANYTKP